MKKKILLFTAMLIAQMAFAQQIELPFGPIKDKSVITYNMADVKGNHSAISKDSIVLELDDRYNGKGTIYNFVYTGGDTVRMKLPVQYQDGEVLVDMKSVMTEMMTAMTAEVSADEKERQEMEDFAKNIKVKGEIKGIPSKLIVGEELPDYEFEIDMGMISAKMKTYDRKVLCKEILTIPAGEFECYVIEETTNMKVLFMSEKQYSRKWYARGIGVVQEETLDKKGRVLQVKTLKEISMD